MFLSHELKSLTDITSIFKVGQRLQHKTRDRKIVSLSPSQANMLYPSVPAKISTNFYKISF